MARHRKEPADGAPTGVRTLTVDVRRAAVAVPVLALLAGGMALTGRVTDTPAAPAAAAAAQPGTPQVPAAEITDRASITAADGEGAPALQVTPRAAAAGPPQAAAVRIDRTGVPARALQAYRHAAALLAKADPSCRLDWSLLAAIGRVESDHGRFGGNVLGADGVARPGIIGIALDGSRGTARIADTDGGRLDRDTTWDRAVGPMQFIPSTWRLVGSDAEPDGVRNPQDIDDATAAAGVYLCSGSGDLSRAADRYRAVHRYNHSDSYVRTVLAIAAAYASGVSEVSAAAVPAARVAGSGAAPGATASPSPEPSPPPSGPPPTEQRPATAAPGPTRSTAPARATAPALREEQAPADAVAGVVGGVTAAVDDVVSGVLRPARPADSPTAIPTGSEPAEPAPSPTCLSLLGRPISLLPGQLCEAVGGVLRP
jgi:membrane-bound lytic murein transglycosylase B